jgi:hypothetical protein
VAGLSMDILTLDIVGVIVILAVEVMAEVLVFQRVCMSWMATSSWLELVKLVGHIGRIAYESA